MKPAQRQDLKLTGKTDSTTCPRRAVGMARGPIALCAAAMIALAGCTGSLLNSRSQSPEHEGRDSDDADTKLVGDFAAPSAPITFASKGRC